MKSFIISFFFIVFTINIGLGQTAELDSMQRMIERMPDDTAKVYAILKLCNRHLGIDLSKAIEYSKDAITLSKRINNKRAEIKSYYFAFVGYATSGQVDSCFYYADLGAKMAKEEKQDKLLSEIYSVYIYVYQALSDNENAMKYGFKNIELMEKSENFRKLGVAYTDVSDLYLEKHDSINALKFYEKAFKNFKLAKDKLQIANTYRSLGQVKWEGFNSEKAKSYYFDAIESMDKDDINLFFAYMGLSDSYDGEKQMYYLQKADSIGLVTNNFRFLPYIYLRMGNYVLKNNKDYNRAKKYYLKGLFYENKIGDVAYVHDLLSKLSDVYIKTGPIDSAIYFINQSMITAKKLGLRAVIQDNYNKLYLVYKSISIVDSALLYHELSAKLKDSLYNENISKNNSEANAKYETKKKEAQIVKQKLKIELEKKRRNRIVFGGIALLLLVGIAFQWLVNRQKRKNKENELALKLKKAETQNLKELNDAKSKFFANITHEFRTPLTLIMGPLQDVIGKIKGENKETLKIAHSNSKKLLNLVNDILELSTLEEGTPELNKSKTCLFDFVKRIFYFYESYAKVRQIETKIELPDQKDILVELDLEKMEKILNNLLSNAFKYSEAGGFVKLILKVNNNDVYISIKDTGVGIDKQDIEHIFDRYYQGQNAENITGTGIGLSFANRLAKMMGGDISVVSKKGEGSTFTLHLPLNISVDCPEDSGEANFEEKMIEGKAYEPNISFSGKPKVLIVEDNYEMQKYLKSILEDYFEIEFADNGFEGLKKLKDNKYDLISSDVMMPGMDGFVFKQEINKNLEWRNIPFILLTARSLKNDKLRGFKLGVDDYITKPFNATEYIARINNLINNKHEREKWIDERIENVSPKNKNEDELISKLESVIVDNISNTEFKVAQLATEVSCSKRNLSRLTKKIIGLTPVNLILEIRLQKAYQLLKSNKYKSISEVRYEVGIDNASYFTRKFVERFGIRPGEVNEQ